MALKIDFPLILSPGGHRHREVTCAYFVDYLFFKHCKISKRESKIYIQDVVASAFMKLGIARLAIVTSMLGSDYQMLYGKGILLFFQCFDFSKTLSCFLDDVLRILISS